MSSIYNRFYTVYECVSQTTDKRDRGNLINCPNFMDYTYEERLKAIAQSSCSCKIFHFHSSDIINTVYAIALFHHENARNYYSSLGGHEGEVKVLFHIKKGSSEESFKNELLIKIKVFTCKVLNGWEEVNLFLSLNLQPIRKKIARQTLPCFLNLLSVSYFRPLVKMKNIA